MFLILAEPGDQVAGSVAKRLPATSTVWLTPAQLVRAAWTHRLDASGCWFQIHMGAQMVDSREVTATLNRLRWLPVGGFSKREDGLYAAMEWQALALSALASLGERVLNRPSPPSLAGPSWSAMEWARAAGRLGLAVQRARATTDGRRHPGGDDHPDSWRRWLESDPDPHEPAQGHEPAAVVPVGPRPVVWVQPVAWPRTCWVVGEDLLGEQQPGDPDAGALARAADCSLLRVTVARTQSGATVLTGADPFPASLPDPVASATAALLRTWARS